MKKCSKCKEEKELTEFHKDSSKSSGLYPQCKHCKNEFMSSKKDYYSKTREKYREENKEKIYKSTKEWRGKNKEHRKDVYKSWLEKNKEKRAEYMKNWRSNNKDKIKESSYLYRQNNPEFETRMKLFKNMRTRISLFLKSSTISKNKKLTDMLGCNQIQFKEYIESKFQNGMSWDNYGIYGWHLDHITPISIAKTEEDLIKLNHHTNFQPLWAIDNIRKGNKII
jgi:hypothetical protein